MSILFPKCASYMYFYLLIQMNKIKCVPIDFIPSTCRFVDLPDLIIRHNGRRPLVDRDRDRWPTPGRFFSGSRAFMYNMNGGVGSKYSYSFDSIDSMGRPVHISLPLKQWIIPSTLHEEFLQSYYSTDISPDASMHAFMYFFFSRLSSLGCS